MNELHAGDLDGRVGKPGAQGCKVQGNSAPQSLPGLTLSPKLCPTISTPDPLLTSPEHPNS